jgi:hypothetical protein
VQIDAPRHFVLHTLESLNLLAKKSGFVIRETIFNSGGFQFWGSELYQKDIPLTLPHTHEWYPYQKACSPAQLAIFEENARALNATQKGDMASFYLFKQ